MLAIPYFLAKFFIILRLTANCVGSEETVYVSRFSGNDSTTCGKRSLPCRTISYAIHQALEGSYIYLDGTNTSQDPYRCQPLDPKHSGIYFTKNISFVGMASRVYISCLHGNKWMVNGTKRKYGLQVSFHGFTFVDTTLVFLDAFVDISDSLFESSAHVAMKFKVFSLARFNLSLSDVVFQRNVACMSIKSYTRTKIFINMVNTSFIQNGNSVFFSSDQSSVLLLKCDRNYINLQLRNCSFQNNTFQSYGIISVRNTGGTIKLLLHQFNFEGNRGFILRGSEGIFSLVSGVVIMTLKFGFIIGTGGTFVTVDGHLSDINISNIEVDAFNCSYMRGGFIDISGDRALLSIKDSRFRNGSSFFRGGVLTTNIPNLLLTIYNCTFHKIYALNFGGVISIKPHELRNTRNVNSFVELHIINSTFSKCASRVGGVIEALLPNLVATISDSLFEGDSAKTAGGVVFFIVFDFATIHLRNVNFIENDANNVAIFSIATLSKESNFTFTTDNVSFIGNNLYTHERRLTGILYLVVASKMSNIVFKSTRLIKNIGYSGCSSISVLLRSSSTSNSITLDTCTFRRNYGNACSFSLKGQASLICKHSTFDSFSFSPCTASIAFGVSMKNSRIAITNSTFMNNACGAAFISVNKNSYVKIEHSVFVRNHVPNAAGGAIHIEVVPINEHDLNEAHIQGSRNLHQDNVLIENVLFEENVSPRGGALALANVKIKLLNCMFLNNFARSQGGQITTAFFTSLTVSRCVFKQTIQKVMINKDEFIASSFLGIYSPGELLLQNTTVDSKITSNTPLIVVTRTYRVNIDNSTTITCPLGSALKNSRYKYQESEKKWVTVLDLSCKKCEYNFYSLQRGHAKGLNVDNSFKCIPCPRGAECLPNIISKANFWGYNASLNPRTLAFTLCPFGYCKSPQADISKFNDCQGKRTGIMCGSCSDGYTESLLSTYCTPIKNCNDYWFWVLFLVLVLSMAILLVFNPPFITYSVKHVPWLKRFITNEANPREFGRHNVNRSLSFDEEHRQENRRLSSSEQQKQDKRQRSRFLEIVFYFYQIAQMLLSSYSLRKFFHSEILPPMLGFFNFEPRLHKGGFLCPFPGLTPKTKLAFKIVPVFGTMIAIFTFYFFHVIINKLRKSQRPSVSTYLQASVKTVFLGYTTLATVGMSLIRCVSVANEDRWFYNGNIICYQWWQYVSLAFNGIFVIPLIFVLAWSSFKVHHGTITVRQFLLAIAFPLPFLLLWLFRVVCQPERENAEESENFAAIKEMLLGPYKEPGNGSKYGAMYWQSVLIARRLILVLIFCIVTEPCIRLFCMTLTCVFVLFFHLRVKPFRNSSANNFESLSLLLLVILGLINLLKSVFVGFEGIVKGPLVTVFKVFHWLEIVILGLFPALVSVLVCFSIISLILRVLFMCCRSLFKCIFRRCAQRNLSQETLLINFGKDINVD